MHIGVRVFAYHAVRDLADFIFISVLKARHDDKYFTGEVQRGKVISPESFTSLVKQQSQDLCKAKVFHMGGKRCSFLGGGGGEEMF